MTRKIGKNTFWEIHSENSQFALDRVQKNSSHHLHLREITDMVTRRGVILNE